MSKLINIKHSNLKHNEQITYLTDWIICNKYLDHLDTDETQIKQLAYKNKTIVEDAKTAYLWAYCTSEIDSQGPPIILFDYQLGRHGEHAKQFLENFSGHLMVDDYAGCKNFLKGTHTLLNWVSWCTRVVNSLTSTMPRSRRWQKLHWTFLQACTK